MHQFLIKKNVCLSFMDYNDRMICTKWIFEKALKYFKQMQRLGVKPKSPTFAYILPICTTMRVLEEGMEVHQKVKNGFV